MGKQTVIVGVLAFVVDFLLILATNRVIGGLWDWKHSIAGSLIGGIYASVCLLDGFAFLNQMHWQLILLATVSLVAFGYQRTEWKRGAVFTLLQILLRGIIQGGILIGVISVAAIWLVCHAGVGEGGDRSSIVDVSISYAGKSVKLKALIDTGNTLRDPITGCGVLVADSDAAEHLLGISREQLSHPIETFSRFHHPGLRLIPYSTVGKPTGMLLGLKADEIQINGKQQTLIVAFAPHTIGKAATYQALAGGIL